MGRRQALLDTIGGDETELRAQLTRDAKEDKRQVIAEEREMAKIAWKEVKSYRGEIANRVGTRRRAQTIVEGAKARTRMRDDASEYSPSESESEQPQYFLGGLPKNPKLMPSRDAKQSGPPPGSCKGRGQSPE